MSEREQRQQVFIRVCKDSQFKMEPVAAALLAAKMLDCHPLEIWLGLDWPTMVEIATGRHPACYVPPSPPMSEEK